MFTKQYIKDFEKLGFGMFVHFGLYSILAQGEWTRSCHAISKEVYDLLADKFKVKKNFAKQLVRTAKQAGCKYITLTTRHHDGFSLFDTKGLSDFDITITPTKRDLIAEFADECRANGIIPFFYHTLLDWRHEDYGKNFPKYLEYLRKSVEILCTNYGKIGGLWFDGMWDKPNEDWQEDLLYSTIRKHQPDAMIINNTGLSALGALGHIELDSVTFERGRPQAINQAGSPKYIASEMCQIFASHWGIAKNDIHFKSMQEIIENLCECRKFHSNFLMNVGPKANGDIQPIDKCMFSLIGKWMKVFGEAIYDIKPCNIKVNNEKDFILEGKNCHYLFVHDLQIVGNENVVKEGSFNKKISFKFDKKIKNITWLDPKQAVIFEQNGKQTDLSCQPFYYGNDWIVRVARICYEN